MNDALAFGWILFSFLFGTVFGAWVYKYRIEIFGRKRDYL